MLAGVYRLSRSQIANFVSGIFGTPISVGAVDQTLMRISTLLADPWQALKDAVRQADSCVPMKPVGVLEVLKIGFGWRHPRWKTKPCALSCLYHPAVGLPESNESAATSVFDQTRKQRGAK